MLVQKRKLIHDGGGESVETGGNQKRKKNDSNLSRGKIQNGKVLPNELIRQIAITMPYEWVCQEKHTCTAIDLFVEKMRKESFNAAFQYLLIEEKRRRRINKEIIEEEEMGLLDSDWEDDSMVEKEESIDEDEAVDDEDEENEQCAAGRTRLEWKVLSNMLCYSARDGDLWRTRRLLVMGVDPDSEDSRGRPALHFAAKFRQVAVARMLLEHGAPVNTARETVNGAQTALHIAVREGHIGMAELLIAHKAKVNKEDAFGDTPLLYAAELDQSPDRTLAIVRLLLSSGAKIMANRCEGKVALHRALRSNNIDVLRFLLDYLQEKHGKRKIRRMVRARDEEGDTLLQIAEDNALGQDMLNLLISHGADQEDPLELEYDRALTARMLGT